MFLFASGGREHLIHINAYRIYDIILDYCKMNG